MSNRTCEMCDQGLLIKTNVIDNVDFKDKVLRVHSAFLQCNFCGCIELSDEYAKQNNRALNLAKKEALGLLVGEKIRLVREKLNLTQSEASILFGGGKLAFTKYEHDDVIQSKAMNTLIEAADQVPEFFKYLVSKSELSASSKEKFQDNYVDIHLNVDYRERPSLYVMSKSHNFETDANGYIELKEEVA